jgi:hypothetical protein
VQNGGGDQSVTVGGGGIELEVLNGHGVAQIANNAGATASGTQTVKTTGALSVLGGSAGGSTNSGVFQNQAGIQTVSAGSITLQGATGVDNGGAFIRNTGGGGDQSITATGGAIRISAGASGLSNRAGIQTNGNQTINGNPDILLTGGTSGAGNNDAGTDNAALITANAPGKSQRIYAGNVTINAGAGGTDTSAAARMTAPRTARGSAAPAPAPPTLR